MQPILSKIIKNIPRNVLQTIEEVLIGKKHIVISFLSTTGNYEDIKYTAIDHLNLNVDDINKETEGFVLFNNSHAKQILDFIDKYKDVDIIIVQCDAGISRSAAVAAALSKIFDQEDFRYFKQYASNMHIYKTILNLYNESK